MEKIKSKQSYKEKTKPIRVKESSHKLLKMRAAHLGITMVDLLESYIEEHSELIEALIC